LNKKPAILDALLSTQNIVLAAGAWAIIALLFFLLFSVPLPGQERPEWYTITTYVLEDAAFLAAGLLCFRNWRSPQIVSGRTVWLAIGLGMFCYFTGNLILGYWEIGLHESPDVSPGDIFFILNYIFLGWGMAMAVISRQLNLTPIQWSIVGGILIGSLTLAYVLVSAPEVPSSSLDLMPPAIAQTAPAPAATGVAKPIAPAPAAAPAVTASPASDVPDWAVSMDKLLSPFVKIVTYFYIVADVILVVMATTLLLAFWGGRFSLSWRFIAAATFCFYISDVWFFYATSYIKNYQTGALPEVFFIFSGCLFAIGATLEYDLSTRSRRTSRRRGA